VFSSLSNVRLMCILLDTPLYGAKWAEN